MNNPNSVEAVIIDARSNQVFGQFKPGNLAIVALDLPDDLWHDFKYFAEQARCAENDGDAEKRYRYGRAALFSLIGFFNAFFDMLIASQESDPAFRAFRDAETPRLQTAGNWPTCKQGKFLVVFSEYLSKRHGQQMPKVDLRIKQLRNILAHPVSRKTDVTVADLYDLDLTDLMAAAESVSAWLEDACKWCGVQRRVDTAGMIESIVRESTGQTVRPKRF